jgi:hypothetical protein
MSCALSSRTLPAGASEGKAGRLEALFNFNLKFTLPFLWHGKYHALLNEI